MIAKALAESLLFEIHNDVIGNKGNEQLEAEAKGKATSN